MAQTYVYIRSEPRLYTVGFYDPKGKWIPESDHKSTVEAAERVHYLNGGTVLTPAQKAAPALLEALRDIVEQAELTKMPIGPDLADSIKILGKNAIAAAEGK